MKQKAAHGHAKKHTGTKKHTAAGAKHHPAHQHAHHKPAGQHHPKTAHTKAKQPHHAKAHKLARADAPVRAVITPFASRLVRVDGAAARALLDDVACCSAEAVAASLRLSGRPVGADDVLALYRHTADDPDAGAPIWRTLEAAYAHGLAGVRPASFDPADLEEAAEGQRPLILGLELPGPHAVLAAYGYWWSWGGLYDPADFPGAVIEEAWAVTWP